MEPRTKHAEIVARLEAHGIIPTQQRIDIAGVILSREQHVSADQVLAGVTALGHRVSKATVYNTLGLFAEKGLIRQVIVDSTKVFYDSNTAPHHHFYNVDTGHLTDFDASEISIGHLPALPSGTEEAGVEVVVRVRNRR